jgi:ribosomal protein S18 acetylase RimI-like enzyme
MSIYPSDWIKAAQPADVEILAQLIALSFAPLAPSQWLIPDAADRRTILPDYFRIYLEQALKHGQVWTTQGYEGVALWMHVPAGGPPPEPDNDQVAEVTGKYADRFEDFGRLLTARHPIDREHHHLAVLAVNPRCQRRGVGTALLQQHHGSLDHTGTPAYLEASDAETRKIYLRHRYRDAGEPIDVAYGAAMYPMIREPQHTS